MSAFFVGQRVRVVCPQSTRHGEECVIEALSVPGWSLGKDFIGNQVSLRHSRNGSPLIFESHELVPLIPPHIAGSWEAIEQLLPNIRETVHA